VNGTVTIVNLSSHTVEKTLPVIGHPRTVASIQNSQYGKIYVASPDSPYLTILRTDLDIVDTTILVEGNIVDVRVTSPNASSGNSNVTSRNPGAGQPCNLPPSLLPSGYQPGAQPHLGGLLRLAAPRRQSRRGELADAGPGRAALARPRAVRPEKGLSLMKRVNAVVVGAGAAGRHRRQGTGDSGPERCAAGARQVVHRQRLPQRRSAQSAHHATGQCLWAGG
jgi:hypothetical protein